MAHAPTNNIANQVIPAMNVETTCTTGNISSGKITFLTKLEFAVTQEQLVTTASENKLYIAMPQNMTTANAPLPASASLTPHFALNTTLKTNVYTASIINGCTNVHTNPRTDPR